jgi:hypothetical protein
MSRSFVQWALRFQNVGFTSFPFGLATVGFLIVTGAGSQGINLSLKTHNVDILYRDSLVSCQ